MQSTDVPFGALFAPEDPLRQEREALVAAMQAGTTEPMAADFRNAKTEGLWIRLSEDGELHDRRRIIGRANQAKELEQSIWVGMTIGDDPLHFNVEDYIPSEPVLTVIGNLGDGRRAAVFFRGQDVAHRALAFEPLEVAP
jgi:hypothetical protein